MPIPKTAELLEPIKEQLKRIEEKLDALKPSAREVSVPTSPEATTTATVDYAPVPKEYRDIVNEVLNKEFGIRIIPDRAEPKFSFELIVPRKYSNTPEVVDGRLVEDKRVKILSYGEGALGVRGYVELVKSNLGSDICARIETDKSQNF